MSTPQTINILGAGIMGLMTAHTLSRAGHAVTVYDPAGFPADNASFMAGGMLAPYSEIEHMDMDWVQAGLKSIELWRGVELDTGFEQNGSLLIACNEDRHILERFKNHLPVELRSSQNVSECEPHLSKKIETGVFLAHEAHLDPQKTMRSLCEDLKEQSNVTLSDEPSTTNHQLTIDCRGLASNDSDLRGVKGETLLVRNPEFNLSRPVRLMHPRYPLYIIPREDHVFMIGATVIESSKDTHVQLRSAMELMSALYALHPSFGEAEILEIKAGIRPSYPDNLPRITIKNNVVSCNGLFRHGYLLAPIMAECVRDYLAGKENTYTSLFRKDQHESHDQRAA